MKLAVKKVFNIFFLPFFVFSQTTSQAQNKSTQNRIPVSITVSGGVSLGTYMSGYLYYATEFMKHNPDIFEVPIVTGSSAGSLNALTTLMSICSPSSDDIKNSLFWRTWQSVDFKALVGNKKGSSKFSVFSNGSLIDLAKNVEKNWKEGLSADCDKIVGISTTRRESHYIKITDTTGFPRLEEKFLLRIKGKGKNKLPEVSNYVLPDYSSSQALLYLGTHDEKNKFPYIRDLILSSSAFPLAFPPYPLQYCFIENGKDICDDNNKRIDSFIDGGVFDNLPMRLAYKTVLNGFNQSSNGKAEWKDHPDQNNKMLPNNFMLTYLNLDSQAFPTSHESNIGFKDLSVTSFTSQLTTQFIEHARSKELYTLLEMNPEISKRIRSTVNYYPRISDLMGAFFGFFEKSFREFDFYLGMYDAKKFLKDTVRMQKGHQQVIFPDDIITDKSPFIKDWKPFLCMRSVYDKDEKYAHYCENIDQNSKIMMQVSLNRLYQYCSSIPTNGIENIFKHEDCRLARAGKEPPLILTQITQKKLNGDYELVKNDSLRDWSKSSRENEFEYVMRMLSMYHFEFTDLGLKPDESYFAITRLKSNLQFALAQFSQKQSTSDKILIIATAEPALNLLSYTPVEAYNYFSLGRAVELGRSFHPFFTDIYPRFARFNLALQFLGMQTVLAGGKKTFALTPLAGPEIELTFMSNSTLQSRAAFRGGYQFSFQDDFGSKSCDVTSVDFPDESEQCSTAVFQGVYSLSFYERFRMSLAYEKAITAWGNSSPKFWNILFGLGLQF